MKHVTKLILFAGSLLPVTHAARAADASPPNAVSGIIRAISATQLTLQTRSGELLSIDERAALAQYLVAPGLKPGSAIFVTGVRSGNVMRAATVAHAKPVAAGWAPDR